jgi:C-terminal processing protease CtpA/Prc
MIAKGSLFQLAKTLDGLPILGCLEGTPAARAGIRYGDVLLSVNGQRTRSFSDYVEAKALRTDGMDVVVFRDGAERAWEFRFDPNRGAVDLPSLLAELVSMRIDPSDPGAEPAAS